MRKLTFNFLVDLAACVVMILLAATGLVVRYTLPPGSGGRGGGSQSLLWGLGRHDWGELHFWLSVVLGVLIVLHVLLHWSWVCATTRRHLPSFAQWRSSTSHRVQNVYGIALVCAAGLLAFALVWFCQASVVVWPGEDGGRGYGRRSMTVAVSPSVGETEALQRTNLRPGGDHLRGSMTLQEVANIAGMSVIELKRVVGIAEGVPAAERIGRQACTRGLSMADVREILSANRH